MKKHQYQYLRAKVIHPLTKQVVKIFDTKSLQEVDEAIEWLDELSEKKVRIIKTVADHTAILSNGYKIQIDRYYAK